MKHFKTFLAAMLAVTLGVATLWHPQNSKAASGTQVWGTTLTSSSATPLYLLGTVREEPETDSTGTRVYIYGRVWGKDTTQIGNVVYDTSSSANGFNYTNISPAAAVGDTLGIVDSTTNLYFPKNIVAGVSVGTQLRGYYGWFQLRGLASVRMTAPLAKATSGSYSNRAYRAGMPICGSAPGVACVATVPSARTTVSTEQQLLYQKALSVFGHIAVNATQDSTLVKAYIHCR